MNNNIMTNKKVLNFIKSIKYLREDVIKGYEKKFDEAIKLYESRKIEKQTTLTTIINNLRYRLIQMTNGTHEDFLLRKIFNEFDVNRK
jgi:hypothetical protein